MFFYHFYHWPLKKNGPIKKETSTDRPIRIKLVPNLKYQKKRTKRKRKADIFVWREVRAETLVKADSVVQIKSIYIKNVLPGRLLLR